MIDLSGQKFGKLTVLERNIDKNGFKSYWRCSCDCGNEKLVKTTDLLKKRTSTCGCKKRNLEGCRFGKLQVIEKLKSDKQLKGVIWKCLCDCGKIVEINGNTLNHKVRSCGCFKEIYGPDHMYWRGYGEISNSFFQRITNHAKRRKININLSIKDLWELFLKQKRKCAISGMDLIFPKSLKKKEIITASLDRIDSKLGYVINNVQWVHKDINFMKQQFSMEYFLSLCEKISIFTRERE